MAQQSLWEAWASLLWDDAQAICWQIQAEGPPQRAVWLIRQVTSGVYSHVDEWAAGPSWFLTALWHWHEMMLGSFC